ncbi:MAG: DNA topoisomerase [Chloroflexi bacterium]|nr:DNA topoisomerase [Chloroflexota bacterium]
MLPAQHFTEPPPRYSEGALIRALEAAGVGRPSTYATIVGTIQERNYVVKERQAFVPTPLGEAANDFLVEHFPTVVSLPFTASMEEDLDRVAAGELGWTVLLHRFYGPFDDAIEMARTANPATLPPPDPSAAAAPKSRSTSKRRAGTSAPAAAESAGSAPPRKRSTSKRTAATSAGGEQTAAAPSLAGECPQCGAGLVERTSSYGPFWGCGKYPQCRYIKRDGAPTSAPPSGTRDRRGSGTSTGGRGRSTGTSRPRKAASDGEAAAPTSGRKKRSAASANNSAASAAAPGAAGAPTCPQCGGSMIERRQRASGETFWGCSGYPKCRGTRPASESGT